MGNAINACAIQKFSVCLLTALHTRDKLSRTRLFERWITNNWGQNYLQLKPLFPCWGIGYDDDDDDDDDDNDDDYLHFP